MRDELRERCRGRWQSILVQLGVPHSALSGYDKPCPMCRGKDRFRFDDVDGRGTFYCRHCGGPNGSGGAGDGFTLAMRFLGVNFIEAVKRIEGVVGTSQKAGVADREKARDYAREQQSWLWRNSTALTGNDPPSLYLAGRCIDILPPLGAVRWGEHLQHKDPDTGVITYWHAMICRFIAPDETRAALHYTYLTSLGDKAAVKQVKLFAKGSVVPRGGAVRLCEPAEEMGIAEGVETALSASIMHDGMPVWAALSAGALLHFVPPPICRKLHIYADVDTSFAGQHTAYSLAYRLGGSTDLKLTVRMPLDPDHRDWNDVLMARGRLAGNVVPLNR